MKNTKIVSIIFSIFILVFGVLFFTTPTVTRASLETVPGVQIKTGGAEGDPCTNRGQGDVYDAADLENCGGGGGTSPKPYTPTPPITPIPPVITSGNSSDSVIVVVIEDPTPKGTLSARKDKCSIPVGSSSCEVLFDWSTTDGVGTSSVTRNPESKFIVQNKDNGVGVSLPVWHGENRFFLYNNKIKLDEELVTASCSESIWDQTKSKCVKEDTLPKDPTPRISIWAGYTNQHTEEGVWTTDPDGVAFAAVAPDLNTEAYRVEYCKKFYGSSIKYSPAYDMEEITTWMTRWNEDGPFTSTQQSYKCSKDGDILPPTSANLSASDCFIKTGENKCNSRVEWSVLGATGDTAVTTPTNVTVGTGTIGVKTYPVSYGEERSFFLYNNSTLIRSAVARASCESGAWDSVAKKCVEGVLPPEGLNPTAKISTEDCIIKRGEDSCNAKISWISEDIVGSFAITTPTGIIVSTSTSGQGVLYKVDRGLRNFFAYNEGVLLTQAPALANCSYQDSWNEETKKCEAGSGEGEGDPNGGGGSGGFDPFLPGGGSGITGDNPLEISISVSPSKILKGKSATITWFSKADSCTATGEGFDTGSKPNGTDEVNPTVTTTYGVTCRKDNVEDTKTVVLRVTTISIIEN